MNACIVDVVIDLFFFQDVIQFLNTMSRVLPQLQVLYYGGKSIVPNDTVLESFEFEADDMFHHMTFIHVEFTTQLFMSNIQMIVHQDVFRQFASHFKTYLKKKCPLIREDQITKRMKRKNIMSGFIGTCFALTFHFCSAAH